MIFGKDFFKDIKQWCTAVPGTFHYFNFSPQDVRWMIDRAALEIIYDLNLAQGVDEKE